MNSITFTCETTTPMFLAGADGQTPELRAPSIKGAMRFWWRAMHGHLSLEELKAKEDEIFGGTDRRSSFTIRAAIEEFEPSFEEFDQVFDTYKGNKKRGRGKAFKTNAMYYLGYGVANWVREERATKFVRPYIPVHTLFNVKIRSRKEFTDDIIQVFQILEKFGGLGSKSRNAFGCFKINQCLVNGKTNPLITIDTGMFSNTTPSGYTSFSDQILIFETKRSNFSSWEEAFREISKSYQHARENIDYWHDWERRELIAQPIVVKEERSMKDNFLDRHAKPYFMHISKTQNGYKGEILLIPYKYLSDNDTIDSQSLVNYQKNYSETLNIFNTILLDNLKKAN